MNAVSTGRHEQPLWTACDPGIQGVVRSIGLRHKYDKSAIAAALQNVLSGLEGEHRDLLNLAVLREILAKFGITSIRVDGDWQFDSNPCVITFTHFYSVLDILLLFYALGSRFGRENLIACGRVNTLRRLELGGMTIYEHLGDRVIEIRQKSQDGPIADLRQTTKTIVGQLAQGKTVMISCTSGTQPLDIGLARRDISLVDTRHGFAYFAAQGSVPVRCAAILIRPYGEAVVALDGPFSVPQRGFAQIGEFAKGIITSLEVRLASLIAEEQHWAQLPS